MKKMKIAVLLVVAGVAVQASAQSKVGKLNFSLSHRHQAFGTNSATYGVRNTTSPGRFNTSSYDTLAAETCDGNITYRTDLLPTITTAKVIAALNAGLKGANRNTLGIFGRFPLADNGTPNDFRGAFTSAAKILIVDYDNILWAEPYVAARNGTLLPNDGGIPDVQEPNGRIPLFNAPWYYPSDPETSILPGVITSIKAEDGVKLEWPNISTLAWGKLPYTITNGNEGVIEPRAVTRVFISDTNNANANLQCFDVTPFFTFEEASCRFCWDTDGRVTDGTIKNLGGGEVIQPPCCFQVLTNFCIKQGSGTSKFYLTIKFNNTQNNNLLDLYYNTRDLSGNLVMSMTDLGVPADETYPEWSFGAFLSELNQPGLDQSIQSKDSLIFSVGGVVYYSWAYDSKIVGLGTMTMQYAEGFGQNPFCGVFRGQVSVTDNSSYKLPCFRAAIQDDLGGGF